MLDPQGTAPQLPLPRKPAPPSRLAINAPNLLVPWSSPGKVFIDNLVDCLLFRQPLQPWITARPAPFWPDVFVEQRLPWLRLLGSGVYHALAVTLIYVITSNWVARPQVKRPSPFDGTKLTYYSVSEYLPEIDTGSRPAPKERKGEPEYAKQRIISLPPAPDNQRQTIITPDPVKITQDVPLPNIVANTAIPAPPEAAMVHSAKLTAPQITPVEPPPDVTTARSRVSALPSPDVVAPAADPSGLRSKLTLPNVPGPEIIGPPPSLDTVNAKVHLNIPASSAVGPAGGGDLRRQVGAINVGHSDIGVAEPKLPVAEQRAVMTIRSGAGSGGRGGSARGGGGEAQAPSVASVTGAPAGERNAGQLIALGIHPVAVNGPIVVPRGSRSGEFAAGPEGQPGAAGTPDLRGGGTNGNGGTGIGTNGAGHGGAAGPPGISVSPGPTPAPSGAVVAANPAPTPPAARPLTRTFPSIRATRVADIARETKPVTDAPKKPDEVFGTKKYYSMTLNMPSVTSAGGSCIIRFAELHEQHLGGDLTAPVAMLKVDPAYPPEAIRERVEGTVTLYAVIHKDGTVGEIRVLHGVDERLDHNAQVALARWQFRPATRNGNAVDLEAVVQIPFIARRPEF